MARLERNANHLDACLPRCFANGGAGWGWLGAFDNYIGVQPGDDVRECRAAQLECEVDHGECGQNFAAFGRGRDRPLHDAVRSRDYAWSCHTGVAQHAHRQDIATIARLLQQSNVPGMKQIEAACDEHEPLPVAFPLAALENQFFQRDDLAQVPCLSLHTQTNRKRGINRMILPCEIRRS